MLSSSFFSSPGKGSRLVAITGTGPTLAQLIVPRIWNDFPSQRIFSSVHGKEGTCPQARRTPAHRWASPAPRPLRTGRSSSASALGSPWLGEVELSDLCFTVLLSFWTGIKRTAAPVQQYLLSVKNDLFMFAQVVLLMRIVQEQIVPVLFHLWLIVPFLGPGNSFSFAGSE